MGLGAKLSSRGKEAPTYWEYSVVPGHGPALDRRVGNLATSHGVEA